MKRKVDFDWYCKTKKDVINNAAYELIVALTAKSAPPRKFELSIPQWDDLMIANIVENAINAIAESKNAREEDGFTIVNVAGVRWFTNLKSVQHQGGVSLEGNYYSPDQNPKYLNYDAIDVESVNKIPCDYEGEMGVPISIFDKLDTDQFELVGIMSNPETLPGIRVIGPEWVDLYRSQGGTGHITANMKSLVGIDANGNAVSYYERVIIRNKNPKPRRNI